MTAPNAPSIDQMRLDAKRAGYKSVAAYVPVDAKDTWRAYVYIDNAKHPYSIYSASFLHRYGTTEADAMHKALVDAGVYPKED